MSRPSGFRARLVCGAQVQISRTLRRAQGIRCDRWGCHIGLVSSSWDIMHLCTTYWPGTGCRGPGHRAEGRTQTAGTQGTAPDAKVKGGIYAGRYSYYTIIEELS